MSWMSVSEWTKAPEITFWASDGRTVFQARYVEHAEDEVTAGADEGHFTGLNLEDDWLAVVYVWTGEDRPAIPAPLLPSSLEAEVSGVVAETKRSKKLPA